MLSIAMIGLLATLSLQLDVGDIGCVDCEQVDVGEAEAAGGPGNQTMSATATAPRSTYDSSTAQALYAKSKNSNSFPSWMKTALGAGVVILGLLLAGRSVLRKLFIVNKPSKNHGGAKASHRKNYHRDAW